LITLKKSADMKGLVKIKSLISLLFLVLPFSFMACNKDENTNTSGNTKMSFTKISKMGFKEM